MIQELRGVEVRRVDWLHVVLVQARDTGADGKHRANEVEEHDDDQGGPDDGVDQ